MVRNFTKLRQRLDTSEKLWAEHACMLYPDYDELSEMILSKCAKVCLSFPTKVQIAYNEEQPEISYFIEPFHTGSTLHKQLQEMGRFDEITTQEIFRNILLIIAFCHKIGILLRDIKLRKFAYRTGLTGLIKIPDNFPDSALCTRLIYIFVMISMTIHYSLDDVALLTLPLKSYLWIRLISMENRPICGLQVSLKIGFNCQVFFYMLCRWVNTLSTLKLLKSCLLL